LETDYYKPYHPYERKVMAPKPETAKLPERPAESTIRPAPVSAPKGKGKPRPAKIVKATKIVVRIKPKAKPAIQSKGSHKKLRRA